MTEREHGRGEGREPLDEEAAWAQIVAGFHQEAGSSTDPAEEAHRDGAHGSDPEPGEVPGRDAVDPDGSPAAERPTDEGADSVGAGNLLEKRPEDTASAAVDDRAASGSAEEGEGREGGEPGEDGRPRAGTEEVRTFTVYAAGTGPRDWKAAEPGEEEDHFVPPEPPPLPTLDNTAKFAWLAVLGGPALLFGAVIFQIPMDWWLITLGFGGFLGGFGTLVYRMNDDEDDFDDPGRGAVV